MNNRGRGCRGSKCRIHGCKENAGYYGLCRRHYLRAWRAIRRDPSLSKLPYLNPEVIRIISLTPQKRRKPTSIP